MIIREGQRKVIMPDRIGERERDRDILCAGEETETTTPGAPARPRKTANPRNYLQVSCFRLTRAFETSGINSVPYYQFRVTGSTGKDSPKSGEARAPSYSPRRSPRSILVRSIFDLEQPLGLSRCSQQDAKFRRASVRSSPRRLLWGEGARANFQGVSRARERQHMIVKRAQEIARRYFAARISWPIPDFSSTSKRILTRAPFPQERRPSHAPLTLNGC